MEWLAKLRQSVNGEDDSTSHTVSSAVAADFDIGKFITPIRCHSSKLLGGYICFPSNVYCAIQIGVQYIGFF